MRLNLVNADVTVDNGNSKGSFTADDNSNTALSTGQNSAVIQIETWAWKQGVGREDEHRNVFTYDSNVTYNNSNQLSTDNLNRPSETPTPTDSEGRGSESSDGEEEEPRLTRKSFANPNYPGFQHLAHELNDTYNNNYEGNNNNNNNSDDEEKDETSSDNKAIDSVNKLDRLEKPKEIYIRSKLDVFLEVKEMNSEVEMKRSSGCLGEDTLAAKDTTRKYETAGSEEAEKGEGDTKKSEKKSGGCSRVQHDKEIFDVYNIETAMPKIDLEAIETHLRAAREEERRRRNDREEIRRRLATGSDADEFYGSGDKPGKKPSLQARLQSGMNLQICFMNETSSDTESPSSESAPTPSVKNNLSTPPSSATSPVAVVRKAAAEPPKTLNLKRNGNSETQDFFARQARLQAEARLALTQAKDRARLQMEADRISGKVSPITEMLRASLKKVGVHFPPERRRVSRQMLTDMNVAQLQVIVNDLHTQIETLNEGLVKFLMERDELHMKQDSMLVDIEDISRYLGAKESLKVDLTHHNNNNSPVSSLPPTFSKPVITRIVSLGKK